MDGLERGQRRRLSKAVRGHSITMKLRPLARNSGTFSTSDSVNLAHHDAHGC